MAEKKNNYRLLKDVSFLERDIDANLHHIFSLLVTMSTAFLSFTNWCPAAMETRTFNILPGSS